MRAGGCVGPGCSVGSLDSSLKSCCGKGYLCRSLQSAEESSFVQKARSLVVSFCFYAECAEFCSSKHQITPPPPPENYSRHCQPWIRTTTPQPHPRLLSLNHQHSTAITNTRLLTACNPETPIRARIRCASGPAPREIMRPHMNSGSMYGSMYVSVNERSSSIDKWMRGCSMTCLPVCLIHYFHGCICTSTSTPARTHVRWLLLCTMFLPSSYAQDEFRQKRDRR